MLTQNKIDLASTELVTELRQALEKRAKLEFQHQVAPLKNPLELRHLRREIARLKTHIRMKEAVK
ncbi:MAG: 50S ribosomal protein L29 [Elusimicrobia bacterium GWC2_65_9]|nr:MAG: 50S ribosomal protein L29 [Elusimicrobia bacterium GWA2_66_18]OGR73880.1 MAG: 50S ribosomal protein L29 [Elusimicrobia bacterium GWC2_65_9]